jgi:hypothetical protein
MAVSQSFTDSGILLPSQKLGRLVLQKGARKVGCPYGCTGELRALQLR